MPTNSGTSPVFKPLKSRFMLAGLGVPELVRTLCALAIGAFLAWSLGFWTHEAAVPLTAAEQTSYVAQFQSMQSAQKNLQVRMESLGVDNPEDVDLTPDEKALIAKAAENGITVNTTTEEMNALMPASKVEQVAVIPPLPRYIILLVLPFVACLGLQMEFSFGTNAMREIARWNRHRRAQTEYRSRPLEFVERIESV